MKKFFALLALVLVLATAMPAWAETLTDDEKNMPIAERTRIRLLIEDLANHRDAQLKAMATLVEIGTSTIPMLLRDIKSTHEDVRGNVALVLGKLGAREGIEPIANLLRDSSYAVRYKAVDALNILAHTDADAAIMDVSDAIKSLVGDKDLEVRALAVEVLIDLNVADMWEDFLTYLTDPYWKVRADAAKALGGISAVANADQQRIICNAIVPLLADDDWQVARSAANSVGFYLALSDMYLVPETDGEGKFKGFKVSPNRDLAYSAIERLLALADHKSIEVKCAAAYALGKVWVNKAPEKWDPIVKMLIAALDSEAAEVRLAAAAALGRVGNEEAVGALITHLEEKTPMVLNVIVESLQKRTLKDFGYEPYDIIDESPEQPIEKIEDYDAAKAALEEKRQEALENWRQWWEASKETFKVNPVIN
jgi:HEAT repeat protein